MEFLQDIKWIFFAAGILLVVAAIFGRGDRPLEIGLAKIPRLQDLRSQLLSGVVGAGFIALGLIIFSGVWPLSTSPPTTEPSPPRTSGLPEINIATSSQTGAEVTVLGTIRPSALKDYLVGVVGKDPDDDCWFLKRPHLSTSNGEWKVSLKPPVLGPAWYGKPEEKGRDATVLVVEGRLYPRSQPGDQIPCPAEILAQIDVFIRKP